jgi:hypothetical protein
MSTSVLPTPTGIARLRPKNQLTIPDAALAAVGAAVGTRFVVTVDDGAIRLDRVLDTYAGSMSEINGAEWAAEIRRDRDAWGS